MIGVEASFASVVSDCVHADPLGIASVVGVFHAFVSVIALNLGQGCQILLILRQTSAVDAVRGQHLRGWTGTRTRGTVPVVPFQTVAIVATLRVLAGGVK